MTVMAWRTGRRWRRFIVLAGILGLALLLAIIGGALRLWGLSAAANVAQLVSVVLAVLALAAGLLAWSRRSTELSAPPIGAWDPFALGVHRTIGGGRLRSYVHRRHDELLAAVLDPAVTANRLVVLRGGSSTGKSRAAYEAVAKQLPRWRVDYPSGPGALTRRFDAGISPRTVLWLSELREYVAGSLGVAAMGRLADLLMQDGRIVVITTLWPDTWAAFTAHASAAEGTQEQFATVRRLLETLPELTDRDPAEVEPARGGVIDISERFTKQELAAARELGDEVLNETIAAAEADGADGHLAQYLAGVPDLLNHYQGRCADKYGPYGQALITAAADAARLGDMNLIRRELLRDAVLGYLTEQQRTIGPEEWWEKALGYASQELKGAIRALTPIPPERGTGVIGYRLADYLDQYCRSARHEELPPSTFWDAVTAHAGPAELRAFANSAENRGLYRVAAQLYKRAASTGDAFAAVGLLKVLNDSQCSTSQAAQWTIEHVEANGWSWSVCLLLSRLRRVGATGQVADLAAWAIAHVPLDQPYDVSSLLRALQDCGAEEINALASRVAAHAPVNDPAAAVTLVQALRNAHAAVNHVATLTDRIPLDDPDAVLYLLEHLASLEAHGQVAGLAIRAADQTPVGNAKTVATLLKILQEVDAVDRVAALIARNPAGHVTLDNPAAVSWLLRELQNLDADGQVNMLAARAASQTPLTTSPDALAQLIHTLESIGAHDQTAALLARDLVGQISLDQVAAITHLLVELRQADAREQMATLAARAARSVPLDHPLEVGSLLTHLWQADAEEQVAVLAARIANGVPVNDPVAICRLVGLMRMVGAEDRAATLAARASHVPVEDPSAVSFYLGSWITGTALGEIQDTSAMPEEMAAIAGRAAQDVPIKGTSAVIGLWRTLFVAELNEQAAHLAHRIASRVALFDSMTMDFLLSSLRQFDAKEQLAEIAAQLARSVSPDDPARAADVLLAFQHSGLDEQLAELASRIAGQVSLENPGAVGRLLHALEAVGAHEELAILLARNPVGRVSLWNEAGVAYLLKVLTTIGAREQVTALLSRNPASQVIIDSPRDTAALLHAFRNAGTEELAATLATRASNAGMFRTVLENDPATAKLLRFGRNPDGYRTLPWSWESLN